MTRPGAACVQTPAPNLFLVGAMKGGTTSAFHYLSHYPEIFSPSIKEPNHFGADLHEHPHRFLGYTLHNFANGSQIKDRRTYLSVFEQAPDGIRYVLDASPSYLYSTTAAENIFAFNPDAKIVILLRDPVTRAWSEYRMNLATGIETQDFRKAVNREARQLAAGRSFLLKRYLLAGLYGEQVARFFKRFPRENIFIDVVDRPGQGLVPVLHRLMDFLDIQVDTGREIPRENANHTATRQLINNILYFSGLKTSISRFVPKRIKKYAKDNFYEERSVGMSDADKLFLRPFFVESNQRLSEVVDIDINHWCR